MPVKPLSFKGDKKSSKKRKHHESAASDPFGSTTLDATKAVNHEDDDSWTSPIGASDLTGPTILVLPTQPPTCLATDANGRIFASPLENMIEDDPRTAEPHDVRQVWVATGVPGSTSNNDDSREIGFKGSHGSWLSCDSVGVLGATREARGTEENFTLEAAAPEEGDNQGSYQKGTWMLLTAASKKSEGKQGRRYLCAIVEGDAEPDGGNDRDGEQKQRKQKKISIALRGDGEASDNSVRLILRMQARFLPRSAAVLAQEKGREKVSRQELEKAVGRRLEDDEVKRLKRAKRHGTYYEEVLDMRTKGSHDKYA